jgi:sugar phosphate permease
MPKPLEPARFWGTLESNGGVRAAPRRRGAHWRKELCCFPRGKAHILTQVRDKMEIPAKTPMRPPCDEVAIRSRSATSLCHGETGVWVLAATIIASSMAFIDGTVVNVALPALQNSFAASVVGVQWVVEAYGLTLAALILVGGSMGDLFGRRRMFLLGVAVFAIASIACGLASSIQQLIAARAIQGMGAAFLVPGSPALISASFDESERGRAIGTWSGSTAVTMAIGPVLGRMAHRTLVMAVGLPY